MILGSGSHQAGRRRFLLQAATGAAVMLLGMVALSGCGGGSSDHSDTTPTPTPTPNGNATVRGRLIENSTSALISGVTVTFGTMSAVTGTDGQFSFVVPAGQAATKLTVTPGSGYSTIGYINGLQVNVSTTGTTIASSQLVAGQTVNVGDIKLFSSDGPPPPPVFN